MTETKFQTQWQEAVSKKNSVLCAGLDPAEFAMGRGDKGLPEGVDKGKWAISYIEAVAPYCAAVKPNFRYWEADGDVTVLKDIYTMAHELGMVLIDDAKLADIGSTNEAGVFYSAQRADAVTFVPFPGNMQEAAEQGKKWGIGVIPMCLMSNPEYAAEKNKLVEGGEDSFQRPDLIRLGDRSYVRQYVQLAQSAGFHGLDALVIGAPSAKNHIQEREIETVRRYVGDSMLVLLPGVGAQGGEADAIWKYFDKDNVIVNNGRAMMFPNGAESTPKQQAAAAQQYKGMLNTLRA
ncbi:MAG: orotidine 5'-phosphate decarboxylase [archaeon]